MKSSSIGFNTYLILLILSSAMGCKSPEQKKHDKTLATVRLYLETPPDTGQTPENLQRVLGRNEIVEIAGAKISVNNLPFLDEASVERALVVETRDGGFAMQVGFNDHGKLIIESVTSANPNRHLGIFSRFGVDKDVAQRWLAAPLINAPISDGILLFTPNTTRTEADTIALGLTNAVKKRKKQSALFNLGTGS